LSTYSCSLIRLLYKELKYFVASGIMIEIYFQSGLTKVSKKSLTENDVTYEGLLTF